MADGFNLAPGLIEGLKVAAILANTSGPVRKHLEMFCDKTSAQPLPTTTSALILAEIEKNCGNSIQTDAMSLLKSFLTITQLNTTLQQYLNTIERLKFEFESASITIPDILWIYLTIAGLKDESSKKALALHGIDITKSTYVELRGALERMSALPGINMPEATPAHFAGGRTVTLAPPHQRENSKKPDINRDKRSPAISKLACHHCGRKNHSDNECFEKYPSKKLAITCTYCKRHGHLERDCRTKQRDLNNGPSSSANGLLNNNRTSSGEQPSSHSQTNWLFGGMHSDEFTNHLQYLEKLARDRARANALAGAAERPAPPCTTMAARSSTGGTATSPPTHG
ncbi:MAG: hypothetical protein N2C12_12980, partial [Planctomycetales bacterium]